MAVVEELTFLKMLQRYSSLYLIEKVDSGNGVPIFIGKLDEIYFEISMSDKSLVFLVLRTLNAC